MNTWNAMEYIKYGARSENCGTATTTSYQDLVFHKRNSKQETSELANDCYNRPTFMSAIHWGIWNLMGSFGSEHIIKRNNITIIRNNATHKIHSAQSSILIQLCAFSIIHPYIYYIWMIHNTYDTVLFFTPNSIPTILGDMTW